MMHSLDESEPEQDIASDEQNSSGMSIMAAVIGSRVSGMSMQDILELTNEDVETIIAFFYKKILNSDHKPVAILDSNYDIWTLGAKGNLACQ